MFYFSHETLADALCAVALQGVNVRLLTDARMNRPAHRPLLDRLIRHGVEIHVLPLANDARMHLKCAVVDGETVIAGAANWSPSAFEQNFEDALAIRSPSLARRYLDHLDALRERADALSDHVSEGAPVERLRFPDPPSAGRAIHAIGEIRQAAVYFCPGRDGIRRLLAQISAATQRVDVGMYLINDAEVVNALVDVARNEKVKVRLLVDSGMLAGTLLPRLQALWGAGVDLRYFQQDRKALHLKSAVIDGRYVWTGTANWTTGALDLNVEDMLFFDSPEMARLYTEVFDGIAALSKSFAPLSSDHQVAAVEDKSEYSRSGWLTGLPPTGPRTNFSSLDLFNDAPFPAFETKATVSYLPDEEYFPVLLDLVRNAHQSILIAMYAMPETKTAAPFREQLHRELERAVGRWVYVYMLLHMPPTEQDRLHESHSNWAEKLRAKGIDVRLNLPRIHLHAKTVVVDLAKVLIGSHNWSEGSLSGKAVYESSALLVLPDQDIRLADYLLSRQAISDMRSKELWEQEIALLRRVGGMTSIERAAFLRDQEARVTP